jgi:hypothetical protein
MHRAQRTAAEYAETTKHLLFANKDEGRNSGIASGPGLRFHQLVREAKEGGRPRPSGSKRPLIARCGVGC